MEKSRNAAGKTGAFICAILLLLLFSACGASQPGADNGESLPSLPDAAGETIAAPLTEPAQTQPEPEPELETVRLSFIAAGDNITHGHIYVQARAYAAGTDKGYDFYPMYEDIASLIANADIAFVNQETVMAGDAKYGLSGYPYFNSPQMMGKTLVGLGFDVINTATNHLLDKGESGMLDNIAFWETQPVTVIGEYRDRDDYNTIRVYEKDGVRIAFLAYTYDTNGLYLPRGSSAVVPYIDDSEIARQITEAKKISDLVFVSMHWGTENSFAQNAQQTKTAQVIADAGADVIIGHHPHVLQTIEWIEGKNGGKTLCVYSLGNLISTMPNAANMVGGIITFDIVVTDSKSTHEAHIENPVLVPTVCHYNEYSRENRVYLLEHYTDELALAHGCRAGGDMFSLEIAKRYVTANIPAEFLPEFLAETK